MTFKFKEDSHLGGDPQSVGEILSAIHKNRGRLLAADVVEEARPEGHALHHYFEWNDAVAANSYREEQARYLIRCVVVVDGPTSEPTPPVRAFANVVDEGVRTYLPIHVVMEKPSLREQLLEEVRSDIERLRTKLARLEDFADVIGMVDDLGKVFASRVSAAAPKVPVS